MEDRPPIHGIIAAFLTPMFLGVAPIFGKMAMMQGSDPFSVAAVRTLIAVALLWVVYAILWRKYIFIYPAGLLGCAVLGFVNGVGSLFYYSGLGLLDASLAQLLNGMYLVFAVMLTRIGGERLDARMTLRILLAIIALVILTGFGGRPVNWLGVGLMLANAIMFAGTVILSQYVLYEMPSRTVTLYTLTSMGIVVMMAWLATGAQRGVESLPAAITPIFILGVTTALSRLAMFAGVKFLGSLQTAILAMTEIGVALTLAFVVLGERLTTAQSIGVGILMLSILLVRPRDLISNRFNPGRLVMANLASQQFQSIAFHRAFGKGGDEDENDVMSTVTTMEMRAIKQMMGVDDRPTDPFPIAKKKGKGNVDLSILWKQGQNPVAESQRHEDRKE
jgi:drug/metabolite transporter (DMT)-like permease